jgi:CHAT domain-containing protein
MRTKPRPLGSWRAAACEHVRAIARGLACVLACAVLHPQARATAEAPLDPVRAAAQEALAHARRLDRDACRAAVDRVAREALGAWSDATFDWFRARAACFPEAAFAFDRDTPVEQIERTFAPWLTMLDAAPLRTPALEQLAMQFHQALWGALELHRGGARALALEQERVGPLIARLRARPADAAADAALAQWARGQYGNAARQAIIGQWLPRLERELGEGHPLQLRLLAASGFSHRLNGRPAQALADAERLHRLVQRHHAADDRWRMSAASELGLALSANGRLAEAMEQLQVWQALEAQQQPPRHDNQMRLHYNLAALALALGDDDGAIHHADESVRLSRLLGDERFASESLAGELSKAQAKLRRGDADAVAFARQAIERVGFIGPGAAALAFALGRHAAEVADAALLAWAHEAIERYSRSRWDPLHAERPMLPMVAARRQPPGSQERLQQLAQAVAIGLAGRSGSLQAQAWFALADERLAAQPDQAIWLYKRGANELQQLRRGLAVDDPGAHRLWLADHEPPLRRLIGLLIDRGRLLEAQQALRVLRDEELHEYQRRSRGVPRAVQAAPLRLTALEADLDSAVEPLAAAVRVELPRADARADAQLSFRQRMARDDAQVRQVLDQAAQGLAQLLAAPLPAAAAADESRTEQAPALPAGQARLLYFVRPASLDIALQRGRRWRRVSVPLAAAQLAREVHAFRIALLQPQADARPVAQRLHDLLLKPAYPWLRGVRELHLQADGVLRLLPFAALHDGQVYAGQRWVLQMESPLAGGRPAVDRTARHAARVLALGRTRGDAEHSPLPAVGPEIAALRRLGTGVRTAVDEAFSARSLAEGLAERPVVVHLASHFVLDSRHEEGAYLLLGDGQRLTLSGLRGLPWQGVHLAVLSACDTGLPEVGARDGRPASGLAAALHDAGAAHVLATLWPVQDGATAAWMRQFYRPWLAGPRPAWARALPDAAWVSRVQRQWLRRHAGSALAHPHYWAGFVWLSGGTPREAVRTWR